MLTENKIKTYRQSGEIAALVTVLSAALMVVGSLLGMSISSGSPTSSFAACIFHPKAFVRIQVGDKVVPLSSSIDPSIVNLDMWKIINDRSRVSFLSFDSNGERDQITSDKTYCCGDAGYNDVVNWPSRTYKMSANEMASVTLRHKDPRYTVIKKCPYDVANKLDPRCIDVSEGDPNREIIEELPIDCLEYSYGWVMKCEGDGCPLPENLPEPTPTTHLFKECRVHFIIDNSSSVDSFSSENKENIEKQINDYRTLPGHQNDTVKVNYQFFNKDVMPPSSYVSTDIFKIDLKRENWTIIASAMHNAVEPQTNDIKTVNFLFTDGKPTVLDKYVLGKKEQCTGSFENSAISGCSPCLRSDRQNCKDPYVIPINSCQQNLRQACLSMDYKRDFIDELIKTKWVDYSISMGDTPNLQILDGVSKNGVIPINELSGKISSIIERECGLPVPTPGTERSAKNQVNRQKADTNNDGRVTALDIVACMVLPFDTKCDIIGDDGKIDSLDRSVQIGLIGQSVQ